MRHRTGVQVIQLLRAASGMARLPTPTANQGQLLQCLAGVSTFRTDIRQKIGPKLRILKPLRAALKGLR